MGPYRQRYVVTEDSLCSKQSNCAQVSYKRGKIDHNRYHGSVQLSVLRMSICARAFYNAMLTFASATVTERGADHTGVYYNAA